MMTFFRNRMFLEGIAFGGACGIIVGTVIAFTISISRKSSIERIDRDRFPNQRRVNFEYLAQ